MHCLFRITTSRKLARFTHGKRSTVDRMAKSITAPIWSSATSFPAFGAFARVRRQSPESNSRSLNHAYTKGESPPPGIQH